MPYEYVHLKKALSDLLKEYGVTVYDILDAMDEEPTGIKESFMRRVTISDKEYEILARSLSARQLNLLLFALQVFYIANVSGLYKGYMIIPTRDEVVKGVTTITFEGVKKVAKALGFELRD
jgi:hypothetical protein